MRTPHVETRLCINHIYKKTNARPRSSHCRVGFVDFRQVQSIITNTLRDQTNSIVCFSSRDPKRAITAPHLIWLTQCIRMLYIYTQCNCFKWLSVKWQWTFCPPEMVASTPSYQGERRGNSRAACECNGMSIYHHFRSDLQPDTLSNTHSIIYTLNKHTN